MPVLDADAVGAAGIRVFFNLVHEPCLGRSRGYRQSAAGLRFPWGFWSPMECQHVRDRAADLLIGKGDEVRAEAGRH